MDFSSLGSASISVVDGEFALLLLLLLLLWLGTSTVERIWWRPRRTERFLGEQGIRGNPYRPLSGDFKENLRMLMEARSKPLPLRSHDYASRIAPLLLKTVEKYGKISLSWSGTTPRVIVTEPELIRQILSSNFRDFRKPRKTEASRLVRIGIVDHEGDKWVKHRNIIKPAFHAERLKRMHPAFSTCCNELIERWEKSVPSEGSTEVNVWPELRSLTGDVISKTAFGSSYEEGRRIFQLLDEQSMLSVQAMQYNNIPGYRFLPTRENKRSNAVEKEIRALIRAIIENREKQMKEGINGDDLLGYLVDSNHRYMQDEGNSQKGMTIEDVIDECKIFYIAGQETSSILLTWTMVLLCMYPSWQDLAREEVLQAFGKNKPTSEGLTHLKLVPMILHEVLRLYPPVASLFRATYKKVELGRFTLPAGVDLLLPSIFVHHDSEYWGKDAHEFNPQRFADGVSKASKSQMAFFPFGGGPRTCIGQNFAMIEAKLLLSMILQRFSLELSPSYIHAPFAVLTLQPQHGAQIILRRL